MPYSNNSGGPWGGGGGDGGDDDDRRKPPQQDNQPQVPDIDELVNKGKEQLRVLMGGGGGGRDGKTEGGGFGKGSIALILLAVLAAWTFKSFYRVDTSQQSVELLFGEYSATGEEGLNFAPWPFVTYEVVSVTTQRTEPIGTKNAGTRPGSVNEGLMLTGDENIVDIYFEVVWNITNLKDYLFNLADAQETVVAVSESAMREVIGRSNFATILNEDRGTISDEVRELIQTTLNTYDSGISIVRLNFDEADPPREVIDSFLDVQAAEQERSTLENRADAYANQRLAAARGESAQMLLQAEGYRAQTVNEATGEASRFVAIYEEYAKAQEVTRKRLYLETMERVLSGVTKIVIDESASGQGVVPYLPLNELNRGGTN